VESFKLQVAGIKLQVSGFPPEAGPPLAEKLAACGLQLEACSRFQGTGFRANRFPFCRGGETPPLRRFIKVVQRGAGIKLQGSSYKLQVTGFRFPAGGGSAFGGKLEACNLKLAA